MPIDSLEKFKILKSLMICCLTRIINPLIMLKLASSRAKISLIPYVPMSPLIFYQNETALPYRGTSVEPLPSGEVWRGGETKYVPSPQRRGVGRGALPVQEFRMIDSLNAIALFKIL